MTPEQFCYWLQGYAEIQLCEAYDKDINPFTKGLSSAQWRVIKDHLKMVLNKITPEEAEIKHKLQKFYQNINTMPSYHRPKSNEYGPYVC